MKTFAPIESAPQDRPILLYVKFEEIPVPCIVVGEVFNFKNKLHHLWNATYADVVDSFKMATNDWDERFTHWAEIP